MDRLVENLVLVLQQCEELYSRMLPIIDRERQAALTSDVELMRSTGAEKENLVAGLKGLDQRQAQLLQQLAAALNMSQSDLNLITLSDRVKPHYGAQLSTLYDALGPLLDKVRKANDENRLLIQHCLRLVKNTMVFFSHWAHSATVYGASGDTYESVQGNGRILSNSV